MAIGRASRNKKPHCFSDESSSSEKEKDKLYLKHTVSSNCCIKYIYSHACEPLSGGQ